MTKLSILVTSTVFSLLGSWLGSMLDHGNMLGLWGLLLGGIGGVAGVIVGYKVAQNYLD